MLFLKKREKEQKKKKEREERGREKIKNFKVKVVDATVDKTKICERKRFPF